MAKLALLIGVSDYASGLQPLPKAVLDVDKLAQLLRNPEICGFEKVDVLKNPDRQDMANQMYQFFRRGQKNDLLLFYFSGHGVVDGELKFYLSSRSTQKDQDGVLIPPTAVAAIDIHSWMSNSTCKAQKQVIILDCCNAGAFPKGMTAKGTELTIDIKRQLGGNDLDNQSGGKGRVILTAATSTQYAFEQDGLDLSVYTHYLAEGLEKGAADLDDDGQISVEELHEYVFKKVKEAAPAMTPEIYNLARDTEPILLARSPKDDPKLKYRREVERRIRDGEIPIVARHVLDLMRDDLELTPGEASVIETEVLKPYVDYKAKLQRYQQIFSEAIQHEYPLNNETRNDLNKLQRLLGLRLEDAKSSEARIISQIDDLSSERGVDYSRLRDLLAEGKWKAADQETGTCMLKICCREGEGWLRSEDIKNFPCQDLQTINQLWLKYSRGRFGFSVQKRIWKIVNRNWKKVGDLAGWRVSNQDSWKHYSDIIFTINAPEGGLPTFMGGEGRSLIFGYSGCWEDFFSRIETCRL